MHHQIGDAADFIHRQAPIAGALAERGREPHHVRVLEEFYVDRLRVLITAEPGSEEPLGLMLIDLADPFGQ